MPIARTFAVLCGILLSLASPRPNRAAETVTIKGSDTLVILNQRWAERYMATHGKAVVQVTGGGSGTGIAALLAGSTDICASSRPMKEKERVALKAKTGRDPVEIAVAKDGIAVYLNSANPLSALTTEQVARVYRGKITNWKDLGGPDHKIILYSGKTIREPTNSSRNTC
jgi:phosphate transport system substrate-binding protein